MRPRPRPRPLLHPHLRDHRGGDDDDATLRQRRVVLTHLARPSTRDDDGTSPSRRPLLATPTSPHTSSLTHPAVARARTLSCCLALALSSPPCHLPHSGTRAASPRTSPSRRRSPIPPLAISPALGVRCHHTGSRPHIPLAPPIYPALSSLSRRHSSILLDRHTPPCPLLPCTVSPTLTDSHALLLCAVSPTLVPALPHMAPSPSHPSLCHRSPTLPSQEHPCPRAASPS